jgi:DNA-binding MarR family transcriptional regulator
MPQDVPDGIAQVERVLTLLMRQITRPSHWRRLAASGDVQLDRTEYTTLARIEEVAGEAGARLTDLAETMGVDISALSRQVRDLERVGLVVRRADPADHRAHRLDLTPSGRNILSRARVVRQEAVAQLLEHWTEEELSTFARLMGRLVQDMAVRTATDAAAPTAEEAAVAAGGGRRG